jgi:hypothetical protein
MTYGQCWSRIPLAQSTGKVTDSGADVHCSPSGLQGSLRLRHWAMTKGLRWRRGRLRGLDPRSFQYHVACPSAT